MPLFSSHQLFQLLHDLQADQGRSILRKIRIAAACLVATGTLLGIYFFLTPFSWLALIGSLFLLLLGSALFGVTSYLQTKLQTISMLMAGAQQFFNQTDFNKN